MGMPKPLALKKVFTNEQERADIQSYVSNKVDTLLSRTRMLREDVLPRLAKVYKGKPDVAIKSFPWPNASNLVIQLAATHCDELLSRIMAIYQNEQIYTAKILGDFEKGVGEDERDIIETFLTDEALNPNSLDLYRTEEVIMSSAIRYGVGVGKAPYKYVTEQVYTGRDEKAEEAFVTQVLFDGPKPENVPLNRFLIDPNVSTIRDSDFIVHKVPYTYRNLMDLLQQSEDMHIFDPDVIKKMLDGSPDRIGLDPFDMEQQESKGLAQGVDYNKEAGYWDVYECWFCWMYGGKRYRIIAHWWHKGRKMLGAIFNFYPDNDVPFEDAKLSYDDDQYYVQGFLEMLESYQVEVSRTHNQRIDNRDLANTGALRVNVGSSLASTLQVYPGVVIPAPKDEIEAINFGNPGMSMSVEDEQLTLSLAKDRSGVDPAVGGTGGGIVNQKRGIYSAQGTAIAMQQLNNRNNLRMSDMRSSHVRLGTKILKQYAHFGVTEKLRGYGDKSQLLKNALQSFKNGKLGLLIKPATASNNKELEKQNDLLLQQTLQRVQQEDMQLIGMIIQGTSPPEVVQYAITCLQAKNAMMRRILKAFEYSDVERLAPLPEFVTKMLRGENGNGDTGKPGAQISVPALGSQGTIPAAGDGTGQSIPALPASTNN